MRYFYYGMDNRKSVLSADQTKPEQREYREDDLVIEEDTIYEIDRECEACKKRIMKGRW